MHICGYSLFPHEARLKLNDVILYSSAACSLDSVTVRFYVSTRHQDWNETIYEITPTIEAFHFIVSKAKQSI